MSINLSPTVLTRQALLRLARLQLEILDSLDHLNRSDDRERIAGDKHFPPTGRKAGAGISRALQEF